MTIPATDVPVISFGESLKQSVAKKKKLKTFASAIKDNSKSGGKSSGGGKKAPAKKAPVKKAPAKKKK